MAAAVDRPPDEEALAAPGDEATELESAGLDEAPDQAPLEAAIEAPADSEAVTETAPAEAVPAGDNGGGELSDEAVDRIARRVAELLGPDAVREVAWEVVPDLAEVVIKERLRELESQVE